MDSQKLIELKEQTEGETKLPIDDKVNPPIIVKSSAAKKRNMIILISSITVVAAVIIIVPIVVSLNKDDKNKKETGGNTINDTGTETEEEAEEQIEKETAGETEKEEGKEEKENNEESEKAPDEEKDKEGEEGPDKEKEFEKIPVIFDVDEGGDDMIAYILANNSKRFNILGITTVSPEYTIDNVTDIWLKFLDFMGFDNKVYKGENHPMIRNTTPAKFSHDYQIDFNATNRTIEEKSAVDFMLDTIANYPRKITLFLLAPLTNFALVYQRNNSIINNIEEIIIMGGTKKYGNSGYNRMAEYNIYSDADAANIVFNCGIKVKVIGTDVTHLIEMTEEKYDKYLNVYKTRSSFLVYSVMRGTFLTWNDNYIHDPATVLYYLDNDIIQLKKYYAVVNTTDPNSSESYYGIMSFLEPNETHGYNIEYSESINLDKYWKLADELVQLY